MKFGTSKQGISYEIWPFEMKFGNPIKEIHMKFGTSKRGDSYEISNQGNSNVDMKLIIRYFHTTKFIWKIALPIRETLNRGIHMFIWSWVLPNREFHMKLGTFKQDMFIWNRVLSNREVPMFICNRALPSRYFIWNLSCPIGEIQMCIWNCVLPIREINLKLGISKARIFIWNLALASSDGFLLVVWNSTGWKPKCEKSTVQGADFAGQDVSNFSSETRH